MGRKRGFVTNRRNAKRFIPRYNIGKTKKIECDQKMKKFYDQNGYEVQLCFSQNAFTIPPKHVLVLCRYDDSWLLTNHPKRGLEFPGGKIEEGETVQEAAKREVWEETGGLLNNHLLYLGEYLVKDPIKPFVKAICYGMIDSLVPKKDYLETDGPVLIKGDLNRYLNSSKFSFLMKDDVVQQTLRYLKQSQGISF
ncbi:RNA deprotection pyrophosphohydrolase [Bacillus sp. FSL W8-1127]|nr:nucleoside triphosphatase YtkD [Bacillus smithii]